FGTEEFTGCRRIQCSKSQTLPWVVVDVLFEGYQAKQRTPGIVFVTATVAAPSVVLFIIVLIDSPVVHEKIVALLGILPGNFVEPVAVNAFVNHVICRPPNSTAPVKLIRECRIVACDTRHYVFSPEFFFVQEMLFNHSFGLLGRRNAGKHG